MVKVALLVGVSEYKSGFKPLPSAIADIQAMQRVLQEKGEFEVTTLPNPGSQTMQLAIDQLFANRTSEDLVLFYFSGHGVKDYKRKFYLTTSATLKDKQRIIVPPTAVAASYLQSQMTDSRSERQVVILDCCYSGAVVQGLTVKGEPELSQNIDIEAELGGKGRAILTSSNSTQESFIQDNSKLSIYTHYLVEGIETGAADLDEDGVISVDELYKYTSKRVQEASPAMTPQFYPVEEGYKIFLARSPQDDPKLKYRQEAQKRAEKGEFTLIGRRILTRLQIELELSPEEAATIEGEILRPYREYRQKLQEYQQAFREVVEQEYPLSEYTRNELQDFQKLLELRDEDIAPIEAQFAPKIEPKTETEPPQFTESVPKSKPKTENKTQLPPKPINTKQLQVFEFDVVTVKLQPRFLGLGSKVELNRSHSQAQYFTEDLGNGVTLDMVYIPGGSFLMGTEDEEIERLVNQFSWKGFRREKPQHEVTVQPFFMGKFQVTQVQYQEVMSKNPSDFKGYERPVEKVSWDEAVEFCRRLSQKTGNEYRLPSEAEWEYACRAGTMTPFHFGKTITSDLANYKGSSIYANESKGEYRGKTIQVGSFPPNAFGLYDMHGNVWEWCQDDWHDNYKNAPTDGSPWFSEDSSIKVTRGGSWYSNPHFSRSACRSPNARDNRSPDLGVRVVCVAPRTT